MSTHAPPEASPNLKNYFLDVTQLLPGEAVVREGDQWLHFAMPRAIVSTNRIEAVESVIERAQDHVSAGGWAAGYVAYDAGPAFDTALKAQRGVQPLVWFGLFNNPPSQFRELKPTYSPVYARLGALDLNEPAYRDRFEKVRSALRLGETYQVNLTMRQTFSLASGAAEFFVGRCGVQPPPYAAFIRGERWAVASFSPELFFERKGAEIESRPMKGTVVRPAARQDESAAAQALADDSKSIAENIMIVDMVRNDIGSIAEPGSVRVPRLLQVERHRNLLQMTSTVRATTGASTVQLFRNLFPPASVTGAPKISTCRLIGELEDSPRGVYCGAIGFIAPKHERFSVAIRTAWIDTDSGHGTFGIGSGLVWDSKERDEFAECLAKRDFLLTSGEPWALIEAIPQDLIRDSAYLDRHLARMSQSARELGIPFDENAILRSLESVPASAQNARTKVRVRLRLDGSFDVSASPSAIQAAHITAALASEAIDSSNPNLRFKTTSRAIFERHLDEHPEVEEVLLFNANGELTEFCRGNVLLLLDGRLVTPDPAAGCLPGIGVALLVESGKVVFGRPMIEDLSRCTRVIFVNSVVGTVPVRLSDPRSEAATRLSDSVGSD